MGNIFTGLVAKLTRRQKKNKPVPVTDWPKPEPTAKPGHVRMAESRPALQQVPRGVTWDDDAKVYRGQTVAQKEAYRLRREAYDRDREDYDSGDKFNMFVAGSTIDESFFYQNGPESVSKGSEYSGGYEDTSSGVSSSYGPSSPSYSATETSYSAPSSSYSDSGGSYSSSGGYSGE